MMASTMKQKEDLLTIQILCDGPIGGMTVTADASGNVYQIISLLISSQVFFPVIIKK